MRQITHCGDGRWLDGERPLERPLWRELDEAGPLDPRRVLLTAGKCCQARAAKTGMKGKPADVRQHALGGGPARGGPQISSLLASWSENNARTSMASVLASMRSCAVIGRPAMLSDAVVTLTQPR